MNKQQLIVRHRASNEEEILERHAQFLNNQREGAELWKIDSEKAPPLKAIQRDEMSLSYNITRLLNTRRAKGYICYVRRDDDLLIVDKARSDDYISIEFNPEKLDCKVLANHVFPKLIVAFGAYRGEIGNLINLEDLDEIRNLNRSKALDVTGRNGVHRINPVNYFDRLLCHRSFGIGPEQIVDRLKGEVERVEMLNDGVLIIVSSELLTMEQNAAIDGQIRALLT